MLDFCKQNKRVRYLIVDEPDRFMRSAYEGPYYEVTFSLLNVKVWYASDMSLNRDDLMSKMLKFTKFMQAEGSNEERQRKSISGHRAAIKEGRYTMPPKPGYQKGSKPGIHQPHPTTFKPLQRAFNDVLGGLYTPLQALKRLNQSEFTTNHAPYKTDKFRAILLDPYYAGIVEIKKQVNARNENGLHPPMITQDDHDQLVEMFTGKVRLRGPRKQYNPEFPMNKLLFCEDCGENSKFTGSRKNNGYAKKVTRYYNKYHCRTCRKAYHRDVVHEKISERLSRIKYTGKQQSAFIEALEIVWKEKQSATLKEIKSLKKQVATLEEEKSSLVREMARANHEYKQDLRLEIDKIKLEIHQVKDVISTKDNLDAGMLDFVNFGLSYTDKLREDWWKLDHDERVRCQQLILPGGISFNSQQKVGTPRISPLYSLEPIKKDLSFTEKSLMVELPGTAPGSASLSLLAVYRCSLLIGLSDASMSRPNNASSRLIVLVLILSQV